MLRKLALLVVLLIGVIFLEGCLAEEYFSKGSYFDGAVVVDYNQSTASGTNDYLTFRFYEKGDYKISFSITPSKSDSHQNKIPHNFTKTIEAAPREIVIEQYILPDFLRITIIKDGKSESHDFS